MTTEWEWANNSPVWMKPRRTVYFLIRYVNDVMEYRNNKRGHLITYRTREQAIRMAEKLNAATEGGQL
jgi:hypothetical protein